MAQFFDVQNLGALKGLVTPLVFVNASGNDVVTGLNVLNVDNLGQLKGQVQAFVAINENGDIQLS